MLVDTSNKTLESPFGSRVELRREGIDEVKKKANSYKTTNQVVLIVFAVILIIITCIVGYNWVMEDGYFSTKE